MHAQCLCRGVQQPQESYGLHSHGVAQKIYDPVVAFFAFQI